jgi:peptidoglycan/LPS O-acetylase OafA/YrhL
VLRTEFIDERLRLPRRWRPMAVAAIALLGVAGVKLGVDGRIPERIEVAAVAVCSALLLALAVLPPAGGRESRLVSLLERRSLVSAGLVSCSGYLWHLPTIYVLRRAVVLQDVGWRAFWVNLVIVGCATALLTYLLHRCVAKPALRRKRSTRVRDEATLGSAVAAPGPAGP